MQLFSDKYTRVGGDIVCYKCWMNSRCLGCTVFSNYSCQLVFPNKYVTYVYND